MYNDNFKRQNFTFLNYHENSGCHTIILTLQLLCWQCNYSITCFIWRPLPLTGIFGQLIITLKLTNWILASFFFVLLRSPHLQWYPGWPARFIAAKTFFSKKMRIKLFLGETMTFKAFFQHLREAWFIGFNLRWKAGMVVTFPCDGKAVFTRDGFTALSGFLADE